MSQTISIKQVCNTGHRDLNISLHGPSGSSATLILPAGASTNLIDFDLSEINIVTPLLLVVCLADDRGLTRSVNLYYEEMPTENQFMYTVLVSGKDTPYATVNHPTSIDHNISLQLGYDGDGVVIVGTGDF